MGFALNWDRGAAEVEEVGGMLGPVTFHLADGRFVAPLAVAPWSNDAGEAYEALPGLMKRLRGEWPCVPFGAPSAPSGLPDRWQGRPVPGAGSDFHGFSAHNVWRCEAAAPGSVTLSIAYPGDHAIRKLTRHIRGVPGKPEIELTLTIEARRDVRLPIALHPVFKLPEGAGGARISAPGTRAVWTFPADVEPGVSTILPDRMFPSLSAVGSQRGPLDLSRLPLAFETEELVQLCGVDGRVDLINQSEGYRSWIAFDETVFTGVVLWISNRGRSAYPWNGRFLALGIEPVRAAFDLGPEVGCNPANPLAAAGTATALDLLAGRSFSTTYRIGADGV